MSRRSYESDEGEVKTRSLAVGDDVAKLKAEVEVEEWASEHEFLGASRLEVEKRRLFLEGIKLFFKPGDPKISKKIQATLYSNEAREQLILRFLFLLPLFQWDVSSLSNDCEQIFETFLL